MRIETEHRLEDFNFPADDAMEDPFWAYSMLRSESPIYRVPGHGDTFMVTRYEDIIAIVRDPETFHQSGRSVYYTGEIEVDGARCPVGLTVALTDPPLHRRYRSIAFSCFTPGRLREYRPLIIEVADSLIDTFIHDGRADLVAQFARAYPVRVISRILGLPVEMNQKFIEWADSFLSINPFAPEEGKERFRAAVNEMAAYLAGEVQSRLESPRPDVLTEVVTQRADEDPALTLPQLVGIAMSLLVAGSETTSHLMANTVDLVLRRRPDLVGAVKTDASLRLRLLEESLRIEPPNHLNIRFATVEATIADTVIPAGSRLLLVWAAANRDPNLFPNPDEIDLDRNNLKQQLAFGRGIHTCVGAPLARLEGEIGLERLFTRLLGLKLAAEPSRGVRKWMRPLHELQVTFEPGLNRTSGGQ